MRKLKPVLKAHESRIIARVGEDGRDRLVELLHEIAGRKAPREQRNGARARPKVSRAPRPGSAET
jgi:hypothetical protein